MSGLSQRWLDRAHLLGTAPDPTLAKRWGVSRERIRQVRACLGVPAYKPKVDWAKVDLLLGTAPDTAIAEAYGLGQGTLSSRRKRLDIPGFYDPAEAYRLFMVEGLTWDEVVKRTEYKDGLSAYVAARRYSKRDGLKPPYKGNRGTL